MRRTCLWLCAQSPFSSRLNLALHAATGKPVGALPSDIAGASVLSTVLSASELEALRPRHSDGPGSFRDIRPLTASDSADPAVMTKKLQFQCRYRGMVEMEILLGSFLHGIKPTAPECLQLDTILREFDNDLYHWLVNVPRKSALRGNDTDNVPDRLLQNPMWPKLAAHAAAIPLEQVQKSALE